MMSVEEKFFSMAESSEKAIEDFNDFADDRAIAWAAREIKHLRELVKVLTPNAVLSGAATEVKPKRDV
jgi:hypothetical protein